jgi:hypothetical protein
MVENEKAAGFFTRQLNVFGALHRFRLRGRLA